MHQLRTLLLTVALTAQDAVLIFSGKEAVPHSRPYMVLVERLVSGQTKYCGGFLLQENFVMTAGNCQASSYSVILGLHNYRNRGKVQKIPVKQTFMREDYDPETLSNDLLLLELSHNAQLSSHVEPIAVAGPEDPEPHLCSVAGWGNSEKYPSSMTPVLMEVNAILSSEWEDFYSYVGNQNIGRGDSGGPLVCEDNKAYGVVSSIKQLEEVEHMFAKIPKHKDWIDSTMNTASRCTRIQMC